MSRRFSVTVLSTAKLVLLAILGLFVPQLALAWGESAQRLIVNRAVDTLPYELRPFFETNRKFLMDHVDDPLGLIDQHPWERNNHAITRQLSTNTASPRSSRLACCPGKSECSAKN